MKGDSHKAKDFKCGMKFADATVSKNQMNTLIQEALKAAEDKTESDNNGNNGNQKETVEVVVSVQEHAPEYTKISSVTLSKKQQKTLEKHDVAMVISAELVGGDTYVHNFKGGNVTIRLPFPPAAGTKGDDYIILYIADDGKTEKIKTYYENGELVFTLKHVSDYAIAKDTSNASNATTGDAMMLGAMVVLMVLGAALIVVLVKLKKRQRA